MKINWDTHSNSPGILKLISLPQFFKGLSKRQSIQKIASTYIAVSSRDKTVTYESNLPDWKLHDEI